MVGVTVSLRRVAGVAATVLGVLLVGAFVVQAVPGVVGADASYVVLSGSMEPTISAGDAVVVQDVEPSSIESGAVITYVRSEGSTPITHRVVEVLDREDGLAFRTKGDANEDPDLQPVPAESVTGEVWFVIPYLGHVVMFANTPTGFAVMVGLPVVAFLVSELYVSLGDDDAGTESPTGDASGEDDAPADRPTSASTDDAIAITTHDLKLSSIGFSALAVYSGYMAFLDPTPVRVAVFAGAAMVVVFVAWLFAVGGVPSASSSPDRDGATDADATLADGGESRGGGDDAA